MTQTGGGASATSVKIGPGDHYVTRKPHEMILTVLGSCVSACIRDPIAGVGGMNHFMLPESANGTWGTVSASLRYGNFAMERLINDLLCRGGRRERLEVKVFGGAALCEGGSLVGPRNAEFVEAYLEAEGLSIAARHLRGRHPRRIHYFPLTGRVLMRELHIEGQEVTVAEAGYHAAIKSKPETGSIELFD